MSKFRVGDWVRVLEDHADGCCYKKGHVGKIMLIQENSCRVGPDTVGNWVGLKCLELVKEPKEGDKVDVIVEGGKWEATLLRRVE